jgi:hypothetical protein
VGGPRVLLVLDVARGRLRHAVAGGWATRVDAIHSNFHFILHFPAQHCGLVAIFILVLLHCDTTARPQYHSAEDRYML